MKILDLNDEAAGTDINKYLVPRLYVTAVAINETVYKFFSESLKELLVRLQRGDAFI